MRHDHRPLSCGPWVIPLARVDGKRNRGTAAPRDPTPTGLRRPPSSNIQNRHNPFQGCEFDFFPPQGWLKNANPELEDEIPSGFIQTWPQLLPRGGANLRFVSKEGYKGLKCK